MQTKFPQLLVSAFAEHPLVCLDVGGRGGIIDYYRPFIELLRIDTFDADADADQQGRSSGHNHVRNFPIGLARNSGTLPLYVTKQASGSSLYPPNPAMVSRYLNDAYGGTRKVVEIDALSYSDFRKRFDHEQADFAKLDTQGSELDILSGFADDDLDNLLGVQAEVEFAEVYQGQPLFCELDAFMKDKGFALFDLRTTRVHLTKDQEANSYMHQLGFKYGTNRISGRLWGGDALYFRDFVTHPPKERKMFLKTYLLCHMFKYYDHALFLLEEGASTGTITTEECSALRKHTELAAPRPTWAEGNGMLHALYRKGLRYLGIQKSDRPQYQAFWTKKSWPNQ